VSGVRIAVRAAGLAGALAGVAGAAVGWHARYRAPYRPVVERVSLRLPPAHAALDGFRIGFASDSHVGPTFSAADLTRNLAPLATERLDLLLLGGDYVSESPRYAPGAAAALAGVLPVVRHGGLAVLGNHDYAVSGRKIAAALEAEGIRVLHNEAVPIGADGGTLWIVGIDDAMLGKPNPAAAFAALPDGAAALCLWHEPDFAEQAARLGAFAQISGHSHGGQLRFPGVGPLVLPPGGRRFIVGVNDAGGMPVYTGRGIGVYRPPVRLRCPPELTVVTLRSAQCSVLSAQ
jgi:predicted MPP superfamily phosphohydrolase